MIVVTLVNGFLNMLIASKDSNIKRFVYAGSSSTYGDHPSLPKKEDIIGKPLSPYSITKYVNELYAETFHSHYGLDTIGLRYFNVFGRRQRKEGAYAAVIPTWIMAILKNDDIKIYGDFSNQTSIISFNIDGIHFNDLAMLLDKKNIAIRTGHHCAQPFMKFFNISGNARMSVGIYNTKNDIDYFIKSIDEVKEILKS